MLFAGWEVRIVKSCIYQLSRPINVSPEGKKSVFVIKSKWGFLYICVSFMQSITTNGNTVSTRPVNDTAKFSLYGGSFFKSRTLKTDGWAILLNSGNRM